MAKPRDPQRYATAQQRENILRRDDYKCRYCQKIVTYTTANMDHVKPWKHGGKTKYSDMVAACASCNKLKGNKPNIEPLPLKPHTIIKHRRSGCIKPNCLMRHHDLHPRVNRSPYNKRDYVTMPGHQTPCNHKQSPNCLRQRCLEERKIPYEVRKNG